MSNFIFTCPKCNQQLEAEEGWIGMQSECPYCRQTVTIEKLQAAPAFVPEATVPDGKTCPFCGQLNNAKADFCYFCKKIFPA